MSKSWKNRSGSSGTSNSQQAVITNNGKAVPSSQYIKRRETNLELLRRVGTGTVVTLLVWGIALGYLLGWVTIILISVLSHHTP